MNTNVVHSNMRFPEHVPLQLFRDTHNNNVVIYTGFVYYYGMLKCVHSYANFGIVFNDGRAWMIVTVEKRNT